MKNTVLTIEYKNYSENVTVNASNEAQVKELIKTAEGYSVFIQGDFYYKAQVQVKSIKRTRKVYKYNFSSETVTYKACTVVVKKGNGEYRFKLPKMQTAECNIKIDRIKTYSSLLTCEEFASLTVKSV